MGIFDDGETDLIDESSSRDIVRRVSKDLFATIQRDNIALEISGDKIKLLSQSRTTLEITCDATNAFRLADGVGNFPDRFLTQAASDAPKRILDGNSCTQDEMIVRVKSWLHEQRDQEPPGDSQSSAI
jgi:hypothetical protein